MWALTAKYSQTSWCVNKWSLVHLAAYFEQVKIKIKINVHVFTKPSYDHEFIRDKRLTSNVRWREMHIELFISLTELLLWWICVHVTSERTPQCFSPLFSPPTEWGKEEDRQKWIMILSKKKLHIQRCQFSDWIQCLQTHNIHNQQIWE